MNTLVFIVYLIGIIPAIVAAMTAVTSFTNVIAIIAGIAALIAYFTPYEVFINTYQSEPEEVTEFKVKKDKAAKFLTKLAIWTFVISSTFSFITASIPPQKTAWMMAGTYAAGKILENPKLQETTGNVVDLINSKVKAETLELNSTILDLQNQVKSKEAQKAVADVKASTTKATQDASKEASDAIKVVKDEAVKAGKTAAQKAATDAVKTAVDTIKQ